jgi:naphthoate synthase
MDFAEIIYEKRDGVARITINRPEKLNAATTTTMSEMVQALSDAWADRAIGVVVLTGVGDRAFCTGGDQSIRDVAAGSHLAAGYSAH